MSKTITKDEIAAKNSPDKGMWIYVDENVYDVTEFVNGEFGFRSVGGVLWGCGGGVDG